MEEKRILVACSALDYVLVYKTLQGKYILNRAEKAEDILKLRGIYHYDLLLIDIAYLKSDIKSMIGLSEMDMPIVALSSEPYDAKEKEMKKAGCCACYIKPIRQELFVNFIKHCVAISKN